MRIPCESCLVTKDASLFHLYGLKRIKPAADFATFTYFKQVHLILQGLDKTGHAPPPLPYESGRDARRLA